MDANDKHFECIACGASTNGQVAFVLGYCTICGVTADEAMANWRSPILIRVIDQPRRLSLVPRPRDAA